MGKTRPRFPARLRMPAAARALKKNRSGAVGLTTCDKYDTAASLGHSKELSIEHSPRHTVPEPIHLTDEAREIASIVTGEEPIDVLEDKPSRAASFHKVEEGKGEDGSIPAKPSALACFAEVLARKAARPERCIGDHLIWIGDVALCRRIEALGAFVLVWWQHAREGADATEVGCIGEPLGEQGAGVGLDLAHAHGAPSGALEADIEPTGAREERGVGEGLAHATAAVKSRHGHTLSEPGWRAM